MNLRICLNLILAIFTPEDGWRGGGTGKSCTAGIMTFPGREIQGNCCSSKDQGQSVRRSLGCRRGCRASAPLVVTKIPSSAERAVKIDQREFAAEIVVHHGAFGGVHLDLRIHDFEVARETTI